jgi:hypothetical protein
MFGIANQLLAAVALCVATTVIINMGRARYSWVTLAPLSFVATTTFVAGWQSIRDNFWPLSQKAETATQGYINVCLTSILMLAAVIILLDSIRHWLGGGKRSLMATVPEIIEADNKSTRTTAMTARKLEICDFTALPRDYCNHCASPPPRVLPKYELRLSLFLGQRIVEVLKDGGPIHPYDKHFRFGTKKARLLLATLPIVQEFAENTRDDGTTTVHPSQVVRDEGTNRNIQVRVEMHSEFIHSSGVTIIRPWLKIEALPPGTITRIGLGVQKAKAICAVAPELQYWLAQVSAKRWS